MSFCRQEEMKSGTQVNGLALDKSMDSSSIVTREKIEKTGTDARR